jgi:flagellar hook-basal body complex protein FliE
MTDAISSILSQIRAHELRVRTSGDVGPSDAVAGATAPGQGFQQTLANAIDGVSKSQQATAELQQAFEVGDPRADLARVMVSMQQSQVAFRATVEVRNRLVQAYQDVMNMPI